MLDRRNKQVLLRMIAIRGPVLCALWLTALPAAMADEFRAAIASNFAPAATSLASAFEAASGHRMSVSLASTGKLYAQIVNGLPADIFLAADTERPALLEEAGRIVAGSRFTYAIGQLVLWSPRELVPIDGNTLRDGGYFRLAIANPRHAPYGEAAREILEELEIWDDIQSQLVIGENIGQAFLFVASGNADFGFVAASQVLAAQHPGSAWWVPSRMHKPIEQQAVLLTENPAARAFVAYLKSDPGRDIIRTHGFEVP